MTLVVEGDRRWLVSPYGEVDWVRNARAAGRVTLARKGASHEHAVREVDPDEAGMVLKEYVKLAPIVLPYFEAGKDDPPEEFSKEARRHPVFELSAVS